MKARKSARRLPADKRRSRTVQAVLDLAAGQNPAEITTGEIAESMQVTQGALFRHFANKDAIWQEVIEWVAKRVLAQVDEAARTAHSPLAALETVFKAHIESHVRHAGMPRIVLGELQRAGDTRTKRMVRAFMEKYIGQLQSLIEQGKVQGEIAPEVDAMSAATLFVGMIQGLAVQALVSGNTDHILANATGVFAIYLRSMRRMP